MFENGHAAPAMKASIQTSVRTTMSVRRGAGGDFVKNFSNGVLSG
jgi:hypothetical protein